MWKGMEYVERYGVWGKGVEYVGKVWSMGERCGVWGKGVKYVERCEVCGKV